MSTRCIIVVTGAGSHRAERQTVRLYQHCDGYPTWVLPELAKATEMAESYIEQNKGWLDVFTPDGKPPTLANMPAQGFADFVIAATLGWEGAGARVDAEPDGRPAVSFRPATDLSVFGTQGDLEWVYLADLRARTLTVYGGDFSDPDEHRRRGPVDPRLYARELAEDHRGREFLAIHRAVWVLQGRGWTVTPPKGRRAADTRARGLMAAAWAYLAREFADAPDAADFLPALADAVGDFTAAAVWADRLDEAGHPAGARLRALLPV